jgi:hypothetical protein
MGMGMMAAAAVGSGRDVGSRGGGNGSELKNFRSGRHGEQRRARREGLGAGTKSSKTSVTPRYIRQLTLYSSLNRQMYGAMFVC